MKILYITAEGFDTPNPNNQMAETMINVFLDNGNRVHLIQSHRKGINPDIPQSLKGKEGFTCDTIPRKVVDKTNFVKRYLNDLHYAFQAKKYWKNIRDVDVIYLQSNPTIIYPMILLKLFKRKVPIVYSIYDVFPGHAYDIGVIKSKFVYNVLRIMQKPCYKMAAAVVVLSEDMKDSVVQDGAKIENVYVVPAWFDAKTIHEISREENRFIKKYNIPMNKFIVQFAGTVGYVFNYKIVLELAKRLINEIDVEIHIIGDGNVKKQFEAEANVLKLSNIFFYPLQPVEFVSEVYSACDVCIIPLMKGVIRAGTPSKAPILMACKRPIVTSVEIDSKYAKMVKDNHIGIVVDIEDYKSLADAILYLKNNPAEKQIIVQKALDFGLKNYEVNNSIEKIMKIFQRVIGIDNEKV